MTGVFSITNIALTGITRTPGVTGNAQFALLDNVISPASAADIGICNMNYSADVKFRINANNSVDVAVEVISNNDVLNFYCGSTTVYHPGTGKIDDVSVGLDVDDVIYFTNLRANAAAVKGNWEMESKCGDTFTAPLGGTFPATELCVI